MKRRLSIGLGILAIAAAIPFASSTPVLANLQEAGASIVKNIMQPKMKLVLGAEKKVVTVDAEGKSVTSWKAIEGLVTVQPGDVLQTTYVLGSALANGAQLTYSIDGGKTFVAKPTIKVKLADGSVVEKPAPAEMYTHTRWDYSESVQPAASVRSVYEVAVK
jgi:hypothetical protein